MQPPSLADTQPTNPEVVRFDRFARFYDDDYRDYTDDIEAITHLAKQCGNPVLELGCGTGRVLLALAMARCTVTGVDISPALLDVARGKLQNSQLATRITL